MQRSFVQQAVGLLRTNDQHAFAQRGLHEAAESGRLHGGAEVVAIAENDNLERYVRCFATGVDERFGGDPEYFHLLGEPGDVAGV